MKYEVTVISGTTEWRFKGKLHREDGPAVVYASGVKYWYRNGVLHRLDGPAVEYVNGTKKWFINGLFHRLDGPAIELADRTKEWWIKGKRYTEAEFRNKQHSCAGQIVEIEGSKYKLTSVS